LKARRDKTRAIKQGVMQQLLTGRVRLVATTDRAELDEQIEKVFKGVSEDDRSHAEVPPPGRRAAPSSPGCWRHCTPPASGRR
jgi:hypothetical protein